MEQLLAAFKKKKKCLCTINTGWSLEVLSFSETVFTNTEAHAAKSKQSLLTCFVFSFFSHFP